MTTTNAALPKPLDQFIGPAQARLILEAMRGEEGEWFIDKMKELAEIIEKMPETYEAESDDNPMAYLHYFAGGQANWWIVEKDIETQDDPGQHQAFGLADLFDDGGELGYISIAELLETGAELDLHFDPVTLRELREARGGQ